MLIERSEHSSPRARPAPKVVASGPSLASPLHLVFNHGSGDAPRQALQAVVAEFGPAGGRGLIWHPVSGPRLGEVAARAVRSAVLDGGVVVAVGGDGTVSAVAHEAVSAGVPMAVLPVGTFNLFARAHGLPLDVQAAARALRSCRTRKVAVGRVGERVFVVSASLGLHPDLIAEREQDARRFGRGRRVAWLSGFVHLWRLRRRLSLRFDVDGVPRRVDASTVLASINPVQLSALGAALPGGPGDEPDAMRLLVMPPRAGLDWLPLLWRVMRGTLREAADVQEHRLHAGTLYRRGRRALRLAVDGEIRHVRGPIGLRFEPGALDLVVPEDEGR